MAERLDLFSTPLLRCRWDDIETRNESLQAAIRKEMAGNNGVNRSNIGGWHSDTDMARWGGPVAHELAEFAIASVSAHMKDVAVGGKRRFNWAVDMWANVNKPGDANQLHCHPGAFWSGVYYVDAGGAEQPDRGGELVVEDPRYPLAYSTVPDLVLTGADGNAMLSQVSQRPEAGLLILFPSWLRHSVRPHEGDRPRISIALNLSLLAETLADTIA